MLAPSSSAPGFSHGRERRRLAPPGLADRIRALLTAALHAFEGEVLSLVEGRFPPLDLAAVHAHRAACAGA